MKKSLIALAALAATGAFAQSTVSIDGVFDAGVQQINYKGNSVTGINGNGSSTSQFNFRGSEDLGGGMKANFRLETDFSTVSNKGNTGSASSPVTLGNETVAAASAFGNGELRGGLEGGFGRVDFGAVNYNTLNSTLTGQPFGTAIGSGFRTFYVNDAQGTSQVRSDNAVKYLSPDLMGFKVGYYYAAKQTAAVDTTTSATANAVKQTSFGGLGAYDMQGTTEMALNYANGPLNAAFSSLKQDYKLVGTGTTESTINTLGANYTMGAVKLFGLYQTNKTNTNSVSNTVTSLSATYTMGSVVLMAQAGTLKNVANVSSSFTGLGADYNLSKMTAIYVRAESTDTKAGGVQGALTPATIAGTGTAWARTALGVRIGF
jgi:predicted porin